MARKRRQTAAQRRASLRNLAKARRARGGGRRRPRHHAREAAANPVRRRTRHRARHHHAREKLPGGRVRVRRMRVRIRQHYVPTRGYTRHYARRAYSRGPYTYRPGHPRTRRSAPRYRRRGQSRLGPIVRHESAARENPMPMAYENPLSGPEFVVIGITGVVGFVFGSFADRFIATHTQTDTGTKSTGGFEIYTDAPAAGQLYNSEAPLAPMGLWRWVAGLGVPVVLGAGAHWVSNSWGKTVMQGIAVGWGLRTLGKAADDALGSLLKTTGLGQRLYGPEIMIANAIAAVAALPANTSVTPNTVAGQLTPMSTAGAGGTLGLSGPPAQGLAGGGGCDCAGNAPFMAPPNPPAPPVIAPPQQQPQPPPQQQPAPPTNPLTANLSGGPLGRFSRRDGQLEGVPGNWRAGLRPSN